LLHVVGLHALAGRLIPPVWWRLQAQSCMVKEQVLIDEDGSFKDELSAMKGQGAFGSFYSALKQAEVGTLLRRLWPTVSLTL